MFRISPRSYVGDPIEEVTVTAQPAAGSVTFFLDGVNKGTSSPFQFRLGSQPGDARVLGIVLSAPLNTACPIGVSRVTNAPNDVDRHVLTSRVSNPQPALDFGFMTGSSSALSLLNPLKGLVEEP